MDEKRKISNTNKQIIVGGAEVQDIPHMDEDLEKQFEKDLQNSKVVGILSPDNANIHITTHKESTGSNSSINNITLDQKNSSKGEGDVFMTNNDNLLFNELKADMRERESRTREEISGREKRFEDTIKKYHEENKDREARLFNAIEKLENKISDENKEIKGAFEKSENRIDESVKHLKSIQQTTYWGQIAFIVGIAAIIASFIIKF